MTTKNNDKPKRPIRKPIEISKARLKSLYQNFTMKEIQQELGVSHPTLLKYLRKFGIAKKGSGNRVNHRRAIILIAEKTIAKPLKLIAEEVKTEEK